MAKQERYLSYLLRLWRENDQDQSHWRASLERTQDGERQSFANLDDLVVFLRQETSDRPTNPTLYPPSSQLKE